MTSSSGDSGWIVVDPLTIARDRRRGAGAGATRLGRAADRRGDLHAQPRRPLRRRRRRAAARTRRRRQVRIDRAAGFIEEATSENVLAGIAMGRRAAYMYGTSLARDARGHVDTGLGKEPARGTLASLRRPIIVDHTPQEMEIDGVHFVFQYVPRLRGAGRAHLLPAASSRPSAAPRSSSHTMHNLYTLRGAKVRDALQVERLHRRGDRPASATPRSSSPATTGRSGATRACIDYLKKQRDTYRYIHDQTLRLAQRGPDAAGDRRDARAAREPAHSRSPTAATTAPCGTTRRRSTSSTSAGTTATRRTSIRCRRRRRQALRRGDGRRRRRCCARRRRPSTAATTAGRRRCSTTSSSPSPTTTSARRSCWRAPTISSAIGRSPGPWRDVYLTGAHELRHGVQGRDLDSRRGRRSAATLPLDMFFTAMATRLNGPKADGKDMTLNFVFTDLGETLRRCAGERGAAPRRADRGSERRRDGDADARLLVKLVTKQAASRTCSSPTTSASRAAA